MKVTGLRFRAAAGSVLFLAVAPGMVAGLVPWLLTGWRSSGVAAWLQVIGWIALAAGAAVVLEAFGRFVVEGVGTPAPVAPTHKLVVGGLYVRGVPANRSRLVASAPRRNGLVVRAVVRGTDATRRPLG